MFLSEFEQSRCLRVTEQEDSSSAWFGSRSAVYKNWYPANLKKSKDSLDGRYCP